MSLRAPIPRGWAMQTNSLRAMIDGVWSDSQLVPTSGAVLNQWTHLAVTHDGAGLYTYWTDGVATATNTFGVGTLDSVGASAFSVGASTDAGESALSGYMYLRLTVGVCRYTATFTPPTNFPDF
jgi:Concanavalin A-like lectin/glucanases superfamily